MRARIDVDGVHHQGVGEFVERHIPHQPLDHVLELIASIDRRRQQALDGHVRMSDAEEVGSSEVECNLLDVGERDPVRPGGADQASHTVADNFLRDESSPVECLEHADVCKAAEPPPSVERVYTTHAFSHSLGHEPTFAACQRNV